MTTSSTAVKEAIAFMATVEMTPSTVMLEMT